MALGHERVQKTFADLTEKVREAFAGVRVVKAYARETWEHEKIEEEGRHYVADNIQLVRTIAVFFPMMGIFANLGLVIVIWLGGRLTILGQITTGDFVAFISYLYLLAWPLMAIGWVMNLIQRGAASMRRINHVLEEVPEISDPPHPLEIDQVQGDIVFKGLSLKYPEQERHAIKDINLHIMAIRGQGVAPFVRVPWNDPVLVKPILDMGPAAVVFPFIKTAAEARLAREGGTA